MFLRMRRDAASLWLAWLAAMLLLAGCNTHVGRLSAGLDAAPARGWHLVDIKSDWKVVFPFELPQ